MEIIPQLIANSIIAGSVYTLVALGFNLIFTSAKFIDMGYGALTAVGGYSVFYLSKVLGLPLPLGILAGIFLAGLFSFLSYTLVYKKLRERKASSAVLLIASLGVFTALQALIAIIFSSQFQTLSGLLAKNPTFEFSGATMTAVQISMLLVGLLLFGLLVMVTKGTMFGKAVTAISDDEEVAKIVGINTERVIGIVFFIAGTIGGLAGIFVGFDTGIEPTMGLNLLLVGIVAAIMGGIGNVYGGIAGAFLLGFAENFGIWKISGEWKAAIAFGLLILFLMWRPKGMFPK